MTALIPITLAEPVSRRGANRQRLPDQYRQYPTRAIRRDGSGRDQTEGDLVVTIFTATFTIVWPYRTKRPSANWLIIDQYNQVYDIDSVGQNRETWNKLDLRATQRDINPNLTVEGHGIPLIPLEPSTPVVTTQLRVGWSHEPTFTHRFLVKASNSNEIVIPKSSGGLYLGLWRAAMAPETIFIGDELEDPDDTPLNVRGMFRDDPIAFSDLNQVAGELLVSVYRHKSTLLGEETLRVE